MLAKIASAVLVHKNRLGLALLTSRYWRMACSSSLVERWVPRRICLSVSVANQRSTWLSQEAEVGVKWTWRRWCLVSHFCTPDACAWRQIQPDDVRKLLHELRIARDLEAAHHLRSIKNETTLALETQTEHVTAAQHVKQTFVGGD